MARLADLLSTAAPASPRSWLYAFGGGGDDGRGADDAEALALLAKYRNRALRSPILAVDAAAAFFFAGGKAAGMTFDAYPVVAPPWPRFFAEAARPAGAPAGVPPRWGWYVEAAPPDQLLALLASRGAAPADGLEMGALAHLAIGDRDRGRDVVVFPVMTALLQLGGGRLVAPPLFGTAYAVDQAAVAGEATTRFAAALLHPIAFALCVLASPGVKWAEVRPPPPPRQRRLPPSRRRTTRDVAYHDPDLSAPLERLRLDGMAGIQGLAAALATCRAEFAPRRAGGPSPILSPDGRPFAAASVPSP